MLVYPDTYNVAMSNLGFQTAYRIFNDLDQCVCERAFLPDKEDLAWFDGKKHPLFSLETLSPATRFDVIAFSISFEEGFLNLPRLLELCGVSALSVDRHASDPLIMAGGIGVSLNPEPIADLMDLIFVGEAEGALSGFVERYIELTQVEGAARGAGGAGGDKARTLAKLSNDPGVYVPSLYDFKFNGPIVKSVSAKHGAPAVVHAVKNFSLDHCPVPASVITTPDTEFSDTHLVEIERGCGHGCRFCAVGFVYLPPRMREHKAVMKTVRAGIEATGKVGLVGAAVSEYPELKELLREGLKGGGELTLSSLRVDTIDPELLVLLHDCGYRTITLAPETGSERMRQVVNKCITDEDIMRAISFVKDAGFRRLKLYFMVGLPTETDEDVEAIVALTMRIKERMAAGTITLSVNPFVPKPVTPFQFHPFERVEVVERRLKIITRGLGGVKGVTVKALHARSALLQAYLARADRRASGFLLDATHGGWQRALKEVDLEGMVYRTRARDEVLPWEVVAHGLNRDYLWKEYQRGLAQKTTPPCNIGSCTRCGVC